MSQINVIKKYVKIIDLTLSKPLTRLQTIQSASYERII